MKRLIATCSGLAIVVLAAGILATTVVAQESAGQGGAMQGASAQAAKKHKETRWEGFVTRSDKDKKMLTVRQVSSGLERDVAYDDATQWTSQAHGSKKVNVISSTDVKDHDRVICLGTYDKKNVLHATLISKRLTRGND